MNWRLFFRRVGSRDGKLLLAEAAIYLGVLVLLGVVARDWLKTGSTLSAWTFVVIALVGHWPLIRRTLQKGDWPG